MINLDSCVREAFFSFHLSGPLAARSLFIYLHGKDGHGIDPKNGKRRSFSGYVLRGGYRSYHDAFIPTWTCTFVGFTLTRV
jgi:hypothetical protein